jgi:hypothetical protein
MLNWLSEVFSNFIALIVTLPFFAFALFFIGFYLFFQDRKSAIRWSIDSTTLVLIFSVAFMYNSVFASRFGLGLIVIILAILMGLLGGLQLQIRGQVNGIKMLRGAWRLGFLFLSFGYVILFVWGIGKNY